MVINLTRIRRLLMFRQLHFPLFEHASVIYSARISLVQVVGFLSYFIVYFRLGSDPWLLATFTFLFCLRMPAACLFGKTDTLKYSDVTFTAFNRCKSLFLDVPFLGSIPLDPRLAQCSDQGLSLYAQHPDSQVTKSYLDIVQKLSGLTTSQMDTDWKQ